MAKQFGWWRKKLPQAAILGMVLALTGCGQPDEIPQEDGQTLAVDPDAAMDTTPAGTPAPPSFAMDQQRRIEVRLLEWEVQTSQDTVPAGEITFQVMNTGTMHHALEVEGQGMEEETEHIEAGGTATLTVRLEPGTYELYCPIVGERNHQEMGMTTELVVRSPERG